MLMKMQPLSEESGGMSWADVHARPLKLKWLAELFIAYKKERKKGC
jgi:hypothetical protein